MAFIPAIHPCTTAHRKILGSARRRRFSFSATTYRHLSSHISCASSSPSPTAGGLGSGTHGPNHANIPSHHLVRPIGVRTDNTPNITLPKRPHRIGWHTEKSAPQTHAQKGYHPDCHMTLAVCPTGPQAVHVRVISHTQDRPVPVFGEKKPFLSLLVADCGFLACVACSATRFWCVRAGRAATAQSCGGTRIHGTAVSRHHPALSRHVHHHIGKCGRSCIGECGVGAHQRVAHIT